MKSSMKKAEIYTIPAGHEPGYAWKWRSTDGRIISADTFQLYYDCVTDARKHGLEVELTRARGITAPGGAHYDLHRAGE